MRIGLFIGLGGMARSAGVDLPATQTFDVDITVTTLQPLVATQTFDVQAIASSGATPLDFLTIFGADVLLYNQADTGVTIGASFAWNDLGAGNKDWTNATAAAGPSLNATDATLSNLPTLSLNGTSQYCDSSLALPAPATTPTYIFMIVKQDSWTNAEGFVNSVTTSRFKVGQNTPTPNISMNNGTQGVNCPDLPVGTWGVVEAEFTGSTADALRAIGGASATGTNTGNNASANNRRMGGNQNLSTFCAMTIYAIGYAKRIPTVGERASLAAWVNANVKSGLM